MFVSCRSHCPPNLVGRFRCTPEMSEEGKQWPLTTK